MKTLKIGLAGLGTVGKSVYEILKNDSKSLAKKHNTNFEIVAVSAKSKKNFIDSKIKFCENAIDLAKDPNIDVVVEVIGGMEVAKDLIYESLKNKKHYITANKALLANDGYEIAKLADTNNCYIGYEASTVGAVPIIKSFKSNFSSANQISEFYGILNGTCNFILTKMTTNGANFSDVLKEAQEQGYAEADPTFDIKGIDAAHKLAILSAIASGTKPNFNGQYIEGVDKIDALDIKLAKNLGYKIKLLAVYKKNNEKLEQAVYPALIDQNLLIAQVNGTYNTILTNCSNAGWNMTIGHGAGGLITASAIVADLTDIANQNFSKTFLFDAKDLEDSKIEDIKKRKGDYFVKLEILKDSIQKDRDFLQKAIGKNFNLVQASFIDAENEVYAGFIIENKEESEILKLINGLDFEKVKSSKFIRVENPKF